MSKKHYLKLDVTYNTRNAIHLFFEHACGVFDIVATMAVSVCSSVRPDLFVRRITLLFVDITYNPLAQMLTIIRRSVALKTQIHTSKLKVKPGGQRSNCG